MTSGDRSLDNNKKINWERQTKRPYQSIRKTIYLSFTRVCCQITKYADSQHCLNACIIFIVSAFFQWVFQL